MICNGKIKEKLQKIKYFKNIDLFYCSTNKNSTLECNCMHRRGETVKLQRIDRPSDSYVEVETVDPPHGWMISKKYRNIFLNLNFK